MTSFNVRFIQSSQTFQANFEQLNNVSDGGYERGYSDGYNSAEATIYAAILGGEW